VRFVAKGFIELSTILTFAVLDVNDNPPSFSSSRSSLTLPESTPFNSAVANLDLTLTDDDKGRNAEVEVECDEDKSSEGACAAFGVQARVSEWATG